ncbi:MAG: ABC-F family ATP-binding cassette domain-containing protein [Saprospiraceae bacterium]
MIFVDQLFLQYGGRILFKEADFSITKKECVGLVGRNGAGKSTLLRILTGMVKPDRGNIRAPRLEQIGYLHQDIKPVLGKTVFEEAKTSFELLNTLRAELESLHKDLETRTDYESDGYMDLLDELHDTQEQLNHMGAVEVDGSVEKILKGLGFNREDFHRPVSTFSGGWQMRVELAKILLKSPPYLFLDEPTNHLDIESIIWFEGFLKDYDGIIVLISHDKQLLDNTTQRTLEVENGKIHEYRANYSKYLELRVDRQEKLRASYENQQKFINEREQLIDKFRAKASKAKMAQSLIKQLDKVERIELDEPNLKSIRLQFPPAPRSGQVVLEAEKVSKSYGDKNVFSNISLKIERGEKVAFVGKNGQGKTTLAKILAGVETSTQGVVRRGHQVFMGYYAQNQAEELEGKQTILETLEDQCPPEMRPRARNILGNFLFSGDDVEKKVSVLSGGERARLALACILVSPINLLILDEPTNHLDITTKVLLKEALDAYDGTMIVVSHDRDFLEGMTSRTIEFKDGETHEFLGDLGVFMEKKQVENLRAYEIEKIEKSGKVAAPVIELDPSEKKKFQRQLQHIEKRIEELEAQKKQLELLMGEADFYQRNDSNTQLTKYKQTQSDLVQEMSNWESILTKLN